jgi:hypothetical protein
MDAHPDRHVAGHAGLMQADAYAGFQPAIRDGTQTGADHRGRRFANRQRRPYTAGSFEVASRAPPLLRLQVSPQRWGSCATADCWRAPAQRHYTAPVGSTAEPKFGDVLDDFGNLPGGVDAAIYSENTFVPDAETARAVMGGGRAVEPGYPHSGTLSLQWSVLPAFCRSHHVVLTRLCTHGSARCNERERKLSGRSTTLYRCDDTCAGA